MADVLCATCRHPARKHGQYGCIANGGQCFCEGEGIGTVAAVAREELLPVEPVTYLLPKAKPGDEDLVDERGDAEKTAIVEEDAAEFRQIRAEEEAELVDELQAELERPPPPPVRPARPRAKRTPKPVPPAVPATNPAILAIGERLSWWDAWQCEGCGSRYFTDRVCCGGCRTIPVTVTVSRREVG